MNRVLLSSALLLALTGFVRAQDNNAQSSTSTTTTTTNSTQTTTTPADATPPVNAAPSASHPKGTKVVGHERDELVQPVTKPVKVTRSVVKAAQQKLIDDGYNPGPVDGIAGPNTRAAVNKFQGDQGLPQNGQLDQNTLAKLNVGGIQTMKSAPADLGRGGKALGHNVKEGHPVEAGKAGAKGAENFGKKVAQGTKSEAIKVKDKTGSALSAVGEKMTGAGNKTQKAGEGSQQNPDQNKTGNNPPQR
jgi:peptidoglycan hydrolase-like protein with peptidoglycan-binding domain